jgi:hypothetical protein
MGSDQVRAALMAMHLPPPHVPSGHWVDDYDRFMRRAEALHRLSQGAAYAEAVRCAGLSALERARLARAVLRHAHDGTDPYTVCLPRPSLRRAATQTPATRRVPTTRRTPRPRGIRLVLRAALSAAVRARASRPITRERVQSEVLAAAATELRAVIDTMVSSGELLAGPCPYFSEITHV